MKNKYDHVASDRLTRYLFYALLFLNLQAVAFMNRQPEQVFILLVVVDAIVLVALLVRVMVRGIKAKRGTLPAGPTAGEALILERLDRTKGVVLIVWYLIMLRAINSPGGDLGWYDYGLTGLLLVGVALMIFLKPRKTK